MRSIRTGVTVLDVSTIPPAIREVVRALQAAGHQAFLVGGCVRDMLRGARPKDFDVATSAVPADVQKTFKRVVPTGIQHGTVTVVVGPGKEHVEVTTFRTEGEYKDGRRPETVAFHTEVEADLSRRDFTINAMALDPFTERLVDPFGGRADLEARRIRCVGSARDRFTEDGLRCLRAVRFATVLDFALDPATEAAIAPTIPIFRKVAMERVREEFQRILLAPSAARGLKLLQSTGLLGAFLPEASHFDAAASAPTDLDVRLAVLLANAEQPGPGIDRLRLPVVTQKRVAALIAHRTAPPDDAPDKALRVWLAGVGVAELSPQLAVVHALGRDVARLEARLTAIKADPLTPKQLALNGAQIMAALGVSQGPVVGQATRFLMDQILSDPAKNTAESLKSLLATFRP